ncbi:competence type IV pilus minor pilin ComGD [Bacillus niameyensis]|uniref:competence type IV pilus minor pilin ComGD n=1 Tax=Bacillus niameyensis TaxID=1522308 RepID=UPI0007855F72|nr:competence type IV pilus minor pilin ComGD [Bacillus niameyensis]
MRANQSEKGFTLIEMMIVLAVISIILSFSILTLKSFSEMIQKKMFVTQLESDLYYAHSYALNRRETVVFSFSILSNEYNAVTATGEVIFVRKLPHSIYIEKTNLHSFSITPRGTVSNFGTVNFRHNQKTFKMTVYIGRGRFSIEK